VAARLSLEPLWWREADAVEERRALIEAFRVEDLEAATADLRARCEELERRWRDGESVTVGDVAGVLLGQWSVSFQTMLADAQRGYSSAVTTTGWCWPPGRGGRSRWRCGTAFSPETGSTLGCCRPR
jgi:hypothetical protein